MVGFAWGTMRPEGVRRPTLARKAAHAALTAAKTGLAKAERALGRQTAAGSPMSTRDG
jgi:hypothetical protein